MKVFGQILKIKNVTKNMSFVVLLFVSFSCFSKTYFINKKVNASNFNASYKVDTTEYRIQWKILPNYKTSKNNYISNSNGFRIICDNDSTLFSFYTNIDSVKFILKPADTVVFNILLNNSKIVTTKIIGYDKSENYSDAYVMQNTNAITLDIPEVSELVKIILMLNQSELENGIEAKNSMYKQTYGSVYYDDVLNHFYNYRKEEIVDLLQAFIENDSFTTQAYNYLALKRFSSLYKFDINNNIIRTKYYVLEAGNHFDMLEQYMQLINDFAIKTNFRAFYKDHLATYKEVKERYMELVPVNSLWNFTEKHFPHKVQHYKIIFSPLESFYYISTTNYNKELPFNQYTYYASTPIWKIDAFKNTVDENYIRNSYRFFAKQLFQYMDDYYKNDTVMFESVFKKNNNWMNQNSFEHTNKMSSKNIFYTYVTDALFNEYYEKYLKKKYGDYGLLNFNTLFNSTYNDYVFDLFAGNRYADLDDPVTLLKTDKFNAQFASLYQKYTYKEFDKVLAEMKEWCAKQK